MWAAPFLMRYFEQMNTVIFEFCRDNLPPDVHGLAFYGNGATGRVEVYGLSPDDGSADVALVIEIIRKIAAGCGVPLSAAGAEGLAAVRRLQEPHVAAIFAQATHLLTRDRFFVVHRYSATDWRTATYHTLPFISSMEEAYAWMERTRNESSERPAQ